MKPEKICLEEFFNKYDLNLKSWLRLFAEDEEYDIDQSEGRLHRKIFKDIVYTYGIDFEDLFEWPINEISAVTKFYKDCGFRFNADPTSESAYIDMDVEEASVYQIHEFYRKLWFEYIRSKGYAIKEEAEKSNFQIMIDNKKISIKLRHIRKEVQRSEGIFKEFNKKTRKESGI